MTQQQADPVQQGLSYMRHQGAKSFGEIDAMLERTAGDWNQCRGSMTDGQATFRPEGEWCAKEVLGHVIVTERSINQDIASLVGIDPPAAARVAEVRAMGVQSGHEESLPISELRERIVGKFADNGKLAASLEQSAKLEQSCPHPIFGPLNMQERLDFHRLPS